MQDIQLRYSTRTRDLVHEFHERIAHSMKETARSIRLAMEELERDHEDMISKAKDISAGMEVEIEERLFQAAEQQRQLSDFFVGKAANAGQAFPSERPKSATPIASEFRAPRMAPSIEDDEIAMQTAAE